AVEDRFTVQFGGQPSDGRRGDGAHRSQQNIKLAPVRRDGSGEDLQPSQHGGEAVCAHCPTTLSCPPRKGFDVVFGNLPPKLCTPRCQRCSAPARASQCIQFSELVRKWL